MPTEIVRDAIHLSAERGGVIAELSADPQQNPQGSSQPNVF